MTIAALLLAEFEDQAPVTRRFLERLPEDKLTWKPHARSMSAGQLAYHLASIPGGIVQFVQKTPEQFRGFQFPEPESRDEILRLFDEGVATVRRILPTYEDSSMAETWQLLAGEQVIVSQPRVEFLRNVMLNHWYQHRGQFSVYLRLLDIAVPASWGPSADEAPV